MRVLLVSDFYPPAPGGLEAHVQRLAHHLARRDHQVSVVTCASRAALDRDGDIRVTRAVPSPARIPLLHQQADRAFPPPWADRPMVAAIADEAQRIGAEVIHVHGWLQASAAAVGERLDIPLVVTLHDYGLLCPTKTLLRDGDSCAHRAGAACRSCPGSNQGAAKRLALGLAISAQRRVQRPSAVYMAVSSAVAWRHVEAGIADPLVVPNFVDYPHDEVADPPLRPTIAFVGPDSPHKGLHLVEEAHRILEARGIDCDLVHAGGSATGSTTGRIRRLGVIPGGETSHVYQQANVVAIAPTWEEPCPTVALEAMAAGRPVVAASIGGLTDLVEDGVTGLLVNPRSAADLADGLEKVLTDPARADAMGRAGRHRLHRFSSEVVVPRIESVYRAALRGASLQAVTA